MKYYAFLNRALARFFAVLATFTLIVSLVPVHAFAFETNNSQQNSYNQQNNNNNHNNGGDDHHGDDNQSQKGKITVTKVISGDDSVKISDFVLKVGNKTVQSGSSNSFDPDTYTVSETPKNANVPTNYVASFSGDCDSNGSITVHKNNDLSCTITNTYTQPTGSITIVKDFKGQAPKDWSFDFSGDLGSFSLSNDSSETTFSDEQAGTYTVTENLPQQGWKTPTVSCESNNDGSSFVGSTNGEAITLAAGEDVTCTFTNEKKGDDNHGDDNHGGDDHHGDSNTQVIQGCKFNDENGNGIWDDNETTLSNWGIELVKTNDPETVVQSTTTGENGCYSFKVEKGDYTVQEIQQEGWSQTAPAEIGTCEFNLSGNDGDNHHFTFKKDDKHSNHRDDNEGDNNTPENICDFGNHQIPQETPACNIGENLLVDGSFESPVGSDASGWDVFASGTSGLSWIVSWVSNFLNAPATANIELHHGVNGWAPSNGTQYAELDSDWGGPSSSQTGEEASTKISQVVTTQPGATYELRYDFSPRPQTGSADNVLNVQAGGTADTQSADGSSLSQTAWNTYTDQFVATGTQSVISFADGGTANSVGTFVDNAVLCKVKEAPQTGTIEITKYQCPADTSVVRSENGVNGTIPEGCTLESGATFGYVHGAQTDANGPYPELSESFTAGGATDGNGILDITGLSSDGRYLVAETDSEGLQLPADSILGLYCSGDGDTSNSNDNQELTFVTTGNTTHCVAYNKAPEGPMCVNQENGSGADAVMSFDQGLTLEGTAVAGARSSSTAALGDSDWNSGDTTGFVSLGFGGSIVLSFDSYVPNVAGADLHIHEATNGVYPLETADIYVSQDNVTWKLAGTADNTSANKITDIDFDSTGYSWIKFVKVVDTTTTLGQHSGADGFDLDAVVATQQVCDQPADPIPMCTIHIVSDTSTQSQTAEGDASLVGEPHHVSWTAVVGDGAQWIWSTDPITDPVNQTLETFTKSFNWTGTVATATLTIAADNSYVAKINTVTAASDATEYNYLASTQHDVKSLIQNGVNNLSFDVTNWAMPGGTYQTNPGGLIYDLTITGQNADCANDGGDPTDGDGGNGPTHHTLTITTTGDGDGVILSGDDGATIDCDSKNPEGNTCEATVDEGTNIHLNVTPDEGSNFEHSWAVGAGTCTGNNPSCDVTMDSDIALTAHFDLDETDGGGSGVTQNATTRTNGSGTFKPLTDSFGVGGGDTFLPTGQVLGASTTTIPVGAPNTGAGGTSSTGLPFAAIVSLLSMLAFAFGVTSLRRA